MKSIIFFFLLCPMFAFGQMQFTTAYNYGGNAMFPSAEEVLFGISTKADVIAWYNRNKGNNWRVGVGASIGYISYYDEQVFRSNTIGMSFNFSDEHSWQVGAFAEYAWSLGMNYGIDATVTAYESFIHERFDLIVGGRAQRIGTLVGVTPYFGFRVDLKN